MIAGGGIGGLAAALALERAGVDVAVFERSQTLLDIGGGIQIWTNGVLELERLGLGDAARNLGAPVEVQDMRTWRGKQFGEVPVGEIAREHGVPLPITVPRGELLALLAGELAYGAVRFGVTCEAIEEDGDGVVVRLAGGRSERGTLAIAADGIDSTLRDTLHPRARPTYAGYQYLRAVVDFEHPSPGTFTLYFGRGDRFGVEDVGHGRIYWFGAIVVPEGTPDGPRGRKAELLERFGRFASPVPDLIEATPEESIVRSDIRELLPFEGWSHGRMTLLGDAAHAATPNLGRGVGEALEDANALVAALAGALAPISGAGDVASALRAYEAERRPATAAVQEKARRVGHLASWSNPIACRFRDVLGKLVIIPSITRDMHEEFRALSRQSVAGAAMPLGQRQV